MNFLLRLWHRLFRRHETVEVRFVTYHEANTLILAAEHDPDPVKRWHISPLEDENGRIGWCYIERRRKRTR